MKAIISNRVQRMVMGILPFYLFAFLPLSVSAQDVIVNPDISYAGTPRQMELGGLAVKGVEGYEDYVLTGLSGLTVGQRVSVPGTEITEAVSPAHDTAELSCDGGVYCRDLAGIDVSGGSVNGRCLIVILWHFL